MILIFKNHKSFSFEYKQINIIIHGKTKSVKNLYVPIFLLNFTINDRRQA
jgi:hypothetical protein